MKNTIRRTLCWPLYLGTLVALVVHALWGATARWSDGVFITTLSATSWPMRSWYKGWTGTCFGYGMMLAPTARESTVRHEMVHVEQNEAGALSGLIHGLILLTLVLIGGLGAAFGGAILFWFLTPWSAYVSALIVAWLRGESAYRGNHLEEAAYASTHP